MAEPEPEPAFDAPDEPEEALPVFQPEVDPVLLELDAEEPPWMAERRRTTEAAAAASARRRAPAATAPKKACATS